MDENSLCVLDGEERENKEAKLKIKHVDLLQSKWYLWKYARLEVRKPNNIWKRDHSLIGCFKSIDELITLGKYIPLISELRDGSVYAIFKEGIKPLWDDGSTKSEGCLKAQINKFSRKEVLDLYWIKVMLNLAREDFDHADDVVGAAVSVSATGDQICVWYKNADNIETIEALGKEFADMLRS